MTIIMINITSSSGVGDGENGSNRSSSSDGGRVEVNLVVTVVDVVLVKLVVIGVDGCWW